MTAKEYLSQYKQLDIEIKTKIEQVEQLREKAMSISHLSGGNSNSSSDKIGLTVAKLVDAESELNQKIERLLELKAEIESVIAEVDDPMLKQVLTLRYINGKSLEQMAVILNKSVRHTKRLHKISLKKVENVIVCHPTVVI